VVIFLLTYNNKKESSKRRFSLQEVLGDSSDCLVEQLKNEIPKKPLRSGAQVRINAIKTWCELIEQQNKRIDRLCDLVLDLKDSGRK